MKTPSQNGFARISAVSSLNLAGTSKKNGKATHVFNLIHQGQLYHAAGLILSISKRYEIRLQKTLKIREILYAIVERLHHFNERSVLIVGDHSLIFYFRLISLSYR